MLEVISISGTRIRAQLLQRWQHRLAFHVQYTLLGKNVATGKRQSRLRRGKDETGTPCNNWFAVSDTVCEDDPTGGTLQRLLEV
jgi:hypothetical protein